MKYPKTSALLVVMICAMIFGIVACSDDDKPKNPIGPSPGKSSLPDPPDGATDQALRVVLNWPGDSADSFVHFQLLFGTENPPPLVDSSTTDTFFVTQPMEPGQSYFWQVIAVSDSGIGDSSSVWTFTTTGADDTREITTFPLTVGASWEYQSHSIWVNRATNDLDFSLTGVTQLSVDSTTFASDSTVLHVIKQKIVVSDGSECEENMFFENTSNGLFFHGSDTACSVGPFPLKLVSRTSLYFQGRMFSSSSELLAYILPDGPLSGFIAAEVSNKQNLEAPVAMSLKYPLKINQRWTYREPGNPFAIDKLVSLDETVKTDAGTFECLRVQWLSDVNADGIWDYDVEIRDWIAEEGLIRREFFVRGIERRNETGELIGVYDFFSQHNLTAIQAAP